MNPQDNVSNPQASCLLLILMGVCGAGKSTLALALAQKYGYEFLDGDDFHTEQSRALMAQGIPLSDEQRAPWVASIKQRLQSNASRQIHTILAFSGLKQKHRAALRAAGLRTMVLHLKGSKTCIQDRVNQRKGHFMAPTLIDSQFASMEEPLDEPDVHLIEVGPGLDQLIQQASRLIEQYLIKPQGTD
jgi:gluconokinase